MEDSNHQRSADFFLTSYSYLADASSDCCSGCQFYLVDGHDEQGLFNDPASKRISEKR